MTLYEKYSHSPINNGRMNDPTASAWVNGLCGDTMEIYLIIENNKITDIKYYTDGCLSTKACGSITSKLIKGKSINHALSISPKSIIKKLKNLPIENYHCSILTINTLHKAIADYMIRYQ